MTDTVATSTSSSAGHKPSHHQRLHTACKLGSLVSALVLSGNAFSQQAPKAPTQMPQAPKAPTVDNVSNQNKSLNSLSRLQPPKIGGSLGLTLKQVEGQDDDRREKDAGQAEVELTLDIEQKFGSSNKAVGRLKLSTLRYSEEEITAENEDDEFASDVERLYFDYRPSKQLQLRAGRQGISDPMESIIDENLDGLLISYSQGDLEFALSHSREDWFHISSGSRADPVTNTMASLVYRPNKRATWMPYVLHRSEEPLADTDSSTSETTWLGVQAVVEPKKSSLGYWFHGSMQDGEETDNDEIEELGGFAVDVGINWSADIAYNPIFTIAAAHATGGKKADRYRQSDLHANNFALNGKNEFRYLGEVLDPELTNIQILTLSAGAEISKTLMADIAIHSYQQVEVQDNLRGTDLEYSPEGENKDLGTGLDLILGYEYNEQTMIEIFAGRFIPGDAFSKERTDAWIASFEIEYSF